MSKFALFLFESQQAELKVANNKRTRRVVTSKYLTVISLEVTEG